jgi:hypothetical protein
MRDESKNLIYLSSVDINYSLFTPLPFLKDLQSRVVTECFDTNELGQLNR